MVSITFSHLPDVPPPSGMADGLKIALTALVGILAFVIGQIIQKLFIEPIQSQKQLVGKIAHAMTYWVNVWQRKDIPADQLATHNADLLKASDAIRQIASDLNASAKLIPLYGLMERLHVVIHRKNVALVSYLLMQWQLRMDGGLVPILSSDITKILKLDVKTAEGDALINQWAKKNEVFLKIHPAVPTPPPS